MSTADEVKRIIGEQWEVNAADVKLESHFMDDLGADSLDFLELILAIKEKFEVEIPDEEAEKLQTVADLINYVENHKSK